MAALINGDYVVTWRSDVQNGPSSTDIYGQRYNAAGTALGTEFRVSSTADDHTFEPLVAALTSGGFVVTWQSYDPVNDDYDIHGQRYDAADSAQDTAFTITSSLTNSQESPSIAALSGGGFVVTWQSFQQDGDGDGNGIFGQLYNASGVAQNNEFLVNTNTTSDQKFSSVTALANGGFVVTWHSDDPIVPGYDIYGQRYDGSGVAQGTDFIVSSNPVNANFSSSVTGLPNGGFVVTWTATDSNGSAGVYGKRYDANGNESNWIVNTPPTGTVAIDGTATENQILTANTATIADNDGLGEFSYQ